MTIPKNGCRGATVAPWRNNLDKSKQKHNDPSHNNDISKKNWSRCGIVAPWTNTSAKSKQKHNTPSHYNENLKKNGVGVARWHLKKYLYNSKQIIF